MQRTAAAAGLWYARFRTSGWLLRWGVRQDARTARHGRRIFAVRPMYAFVLRRGRPITGWSRPWSSSPRTTSTAPGAPRIFMSRSVVLEQGCRPALCR